MDKLKKAIGALKSSLAIHEANLSNAVNADAKAQIEAAISEKKALIEAMEEAVAQAEEGEEDKTAELQSRIDELAAQFDELTNAKKAQPTMDLKEFTNSKETLKAFSDIVMNSRNADDFRNNWNGYLVKNNITPNTVMLPAAIVNEINDTYTKTADGFMDVVDATGLKVFKVLTDTGNEGAHGHTKGSKKTEQTLTMASKEVRPMMVYKYITIDRETILEDVNGVLVQYIARELASRIMQTVIAAILAPTTSTDLTKVEAIRAAGGNYITITDATANIGLCRFSAVEGDRVAVMNYATYADVCGYFLTNAKVMLGKDDLAAQLGCSRIILTNLATDKGVLILRKGAYKLVGDAGLDSFEDFTLSTNSNEFLTEWYVGGALCEPNSAEFFTMK